MGNILKKGPGMAMGAAGVNHNHCVEDSNKHRTNDIEPFEEGFDPFGTDRPENFVAAIKNAFGGDLTNLQNPLQNNHGESIQKLKFGNGVSMTFLDFGKNEKGKEKVSPNSSKLEPSQEQEVNHIQRIQFPNGTAIHLKNGMLHRTNGAAIEFPGGGSVFFVDGKLHRDSGPAIHWPFEEDCQWFKHGVKISSPYQTADAIKLLRMKMHNGSNNGSKPKE
jgi:hypothetical protein